MNKLTLTMVLAGCDAVTFYLPQPTRDDYPVILGSLMRKAKHSGAIDVVPGYDSLLVMFNHDTHCAEDFHQSLIAELVIAEEAIKTPISERIVRIPVCYHTDYAFDLDELSTRKGQSIESVIEIHLARTYTVCCQGFTPGFAFLGYVDNSIASPRRPNPRPHIPAGSVGIAGTQTGVYPTDSPGGWNIIGRTPKYLYAPKMGIISCFEMGDKVQFYRISKDDFNTWGKQ